MTKLKESPSQTAGPYVHIGCVPSTAGLEQRGMGPQLGSAMVLDAGLVAPITIDLIIEDGNGEPVCDALVEIWQAGPDGSYQRGKAFSSWGRQATDLDTGVARFETVKPAKAQGQSPHILVWIVARGINLGLTTRIYFPDEDNTGDPVLALAGSRAVSLIATKTETGYAHIIRLQGPKETVFFDV